MQKERELKELKDRVAEICPALKPLIVEGDIIKGRKVGAFIYSPDGVMIDAQIKALARIAEEWNTCWAMFPSPIKGVVFNLMDYYYN